LIVAAPDLAAQRTTPAAVTGTRSFGAEALGGTIGTVAAGGWADTNPSAIGALVGALAGAAAIIGVEHFITEEMNQTIGNGGTLVLFSVTQGILAAFGSRIGAQLRGN
jgi:hypothetical protein